ncbi:MAG TPA: glutathione S-transferase family protein [Thermoanaerobaculia bacterium]|nr:glutathione S-transferase family protein [Thermoanaerobaculia bacterium]
MKVYGDHESGNCYKVRLLLGHLDRSYQWVDVDVLARETRTPEFLKKNPNGRIPLLELDDGSFLAESNAILWYLARGTDFVPVRPFDQAKVLEWLFFEQYSHEPYIATSRYWIHYLEARERYAGKLAEKREPGYAALRVMEQHLAEQPFLVGGRLTVADIALYAYTHVAHEGDFDLSGLPAVRRWLDRVAAVPGHVPMRRRQRLAAPDGG